MPKSTIQKAHCRNHIELIYAPNIKAKSKPPQVTITTTDYLSMYTNTLQSYKFTVEFFIIEMNNIYLI